MEVEDEPNTDEETVTGPAPKLPHVMYYGGGGDKGSGNQSAGATWNGIV